ncbi:MAG: PAS domain S-box protein [Proteobacteria bacterium]|nr:PAS domain S-box protein [Pseudomonadota bacterium]
MGNKTIYNKLDKTPSDHDLLKTISEPHDKKPNWLQLVIDSLPQHIFWKDQNGIYLGCNENFAQEAGIDNKADIVGKTDSDLEWNNIDVNYNDVIERNIIDSNTSQYHITNSRIRADGKQIWIDTCKIFMRDHYGNIIGTLVSYENITERKEAESGVQHYQQQLERLVSERTLYLDNANKELKEQRDLLQTLIDVIPNPIFYKDTDGICLGCNCAFEEYLGEKREYLVGKSVFDILPKEAAEKHHEYDLETFSNPELHQQTEEEILHKDGSKHYLVCNKATYKDSSGKVAGLIGILNDITDLKNTQDSLIELGIENEALIRSISSFLIGVDSNGLITVWNNMAENIFGIKSEEVKGIPLNECGCLWEWEKIKAGINQCINSRKPIRVDDVVFAKADGKSGYLGITLNPMFLEETDQTGFLLMGADITERKQMELQFAQANKLESIGQLAAGIAHEINTPIQYIGDNILFLRDTYKDIESLIRYFRQLMDAVKNGKQTDNIVYEAQKSIEEMDLDYLTREIPLAIQQTQEGVAQVAKIIRSMKDFSHPGEDAKAGVDINHALENIITVSRNEWKYAADIETDFDESLPMVFGHVGELNQVFLNIIVNAAHAVSDVVNKSPDKKGVIYLSTRKKNAWVEITIRDTGTGIPENIRARIFDPFFTTKEVGKGTGQGLAISHSIIVQKHSGRLSFETKEGGGTAFTICLPVRDASEPLGG